MKLFTVLESRMVMQILVVCVIFLSPIDSFSQTNPVLSNSKVDAEANRLLKVNTDVLPEKIDFWVDSLGLSDSEKDWQYLMLYKADALIVTGEYTSAFTLSNLVREKAKRSGTMEPHMDFWINYIIGRYYLLINERGNGLERLTEAIRIADSVENIEDQIMGRVYFAEALRPTLKKAEAADYLKKAEELAKANHPGLLANVYDRYAATAIVYSRRDLYVKLALEHVDKSQDKRLYGAILLQASFMQGDDHVLRDSLLSLATEQFKAIGDDRNLTLCYMNRSLFATEKNNHTASLLYLDSAERAVGTRQWVDEIKRIALSRTINYKALDIKDSIIKYQGVTIYWEGKESWKKDLDRLFFMESQFQEKEQKIELREQKLIIDQANARNRWFIALLILSAAFISAMAYFLIRTRRQKRQIEGKNEEIEIINKDLSDSLEENVVLMNEIHHRVKNNLQVVSSLLESQADATDNSEVETAISGAKSRIGTMAFVHDLLYRQKDHVNLDIGNYLTQLAKQVAVIHQDADDLDIDIECSNIILPLRKAIHLGVLINELLTNSHKYARSDEDILRLKIRLYESENEHVLEYSDNGPGLTKGLNSEKKGSIGMYVLKSMSRQLRGKLSYETNSGAIFVLRFKK